VQGNHERSLLKYLAADKRHKPLFEDLKKELGADLETWRDRIEAMPLYLETEDWLVVHAGLQPGLHPRETEARILTEIRTWDGSGAELEREQDPAWYECYEDDKLIVFGHWARRGLVWRENAIGLDTGCVYGGKLSGLLLPERRLIQVPARKVYRAFD
jgi:hypothetical protein